MKKYFILMVFYVLPFYLKAQNLVPNPSFEDTLSCPQIQNQLYKAIGWRSFASTPDYFNECSSLAGVPNNFAGFKYAKSGQGYAGLISFIIAPANNFREFIGIKLTTPLIIGQMYYVSFCVAVGLNHNELGLAINHLGCKFSIDSFSAQNPILTSNYNHIDCNYIVSDTITWTTVSGTFNADSTYQYISIGNFYTDSLTSVTIIDSNTVKAYYYIDDVCVSIDSNKCIFINDIVESSKDEHIEIYPNPFSKGLNLKSKYFNNYEIFDVLGRKLICNTINYQNEIESIDLSNLSKGQYFIKLYSLKTVVVKKIIKI